MLFITMALKFLIIKWNYYQIVSKISKAWHIDSIQVVFNYTNRTLYSIDAFQDLSSELVIEVGSFINKEIKFSVIFVNWWRI